MHIFLSAGSGDGATALAAFDAALQDAGIANYNLLVLSSVIPPGAAVVPAPFRPDGDQWGQRLYLVMAERRETTPGQEAWAGLGWVQQADGRGVFVEHHGHSQAEVEDALRASLGEMIERRPASWGEPHLLTHGVRCQDRPVCAVVVAAYRSEPW